jgi:hypothetical protein
MYGATMVMGKEVNALSVGVTARTQVELPQGAFSLLHFDADHPLEMRFVIWRLKPGEKLAFFENAKEEEP